LRSIETCVCCRWRWRISKHRLTWACVHAYMLACRAAPVQVVYTSSRSVPVLLLKATATRPELSLLETTRYHLFLSHIWRTGQDQVAVIKRQLQLSLPGVRIFLDVDDLSDISALETYIEKSTVVLIFLSQGYFVSTNCLREVRSSAKEGKPLVLVHESDLR